MSFQNTISEDGSININVIPSFGHIVNVNETDKNKVVHLSLFSSMKLINGNRKKEHFTINLKTLILLAMLHSVSAKLLKNQSMRSIFTSTSKNLDSAKDSDFDNSSTLFIKFNNFVTIVNL